MDNDNKELELESQNTGVERQETEFDPTESEDFYSNLEAAIGGVDVQAEAKAAEAMLAEDLLNGISEDAVPQGTFTEDDELFAGVDAALTEQIEQEFGKDTEAVSAEKTSDNKVAAVWKSIPTWTKVLTCILLVLLLSVGLLFGTKRGRNIVYKVAVGIAMGWANKETPDDNELVTLPPEPTTDPDQNPDATPIPTGDPAQNPDATPTPTTDPAQNPDATPTPTPTLIPEPTATPTPAIKIMDDEDIINVLLLGEENIYGSKRGRTDAIIVVSVNLNGGPLKMISFQRDLYVSIEGHADDKLNSAYAKGGSRLIMETIEKNFGIDIDSYVKVDFEGFESIIDNLGGLRLSLTARESEYLNTTKYISKPEERNTVAGEQTMTGAQVLGYCRVRKVPTAEGVKDDWGRNYRQRTVLKAIFNQYKSKNITELASVMRDCFNYVTVPANLEDYAVECLQAVIENKMFEIETMQMPQKGLYTDVKVSAKDVIVAHPENIEDLQNFLYGE